MGRFMDTEVASWLDTFDVVWHSLHHESPEVSSPFTSEIIGGSYGRVKITMGSTEGRTLFNISAGKFSGLPAVKVTHIGGWDSQVNGRMRYYIELDPPIRMQLGQTFVINAGDIALSID